MKVCTPKQLARFNTAETILVISKYPFQQVAQSHHGVASYTRDILRALAKETNKKFVVLAEDTFTNQPYQDSKNILVVPAFSDNYFFVVSILKALNTFSEIKLIHVHSEFITSGKPLQMALVIPLLATLKTMGKKVYFTAHNVIDDFGFIASHLGKKTTDPILRILTLLMPWYYRILGVCVDSIIALDASVENRLSKLVPKGKLYLSPLWIHPASYEQSFRDYWRQKMDYQPDDFVLVCFGFMTKYKGVDWLVEAVDYANKHAGGKRIKLILAGGKAASMKGKAHYEAFYTRLAQKVATSPHMILTGFIPDEHVARYMAVADLAVLPYRGILGASASWAQSLSYGKPFLLSNELESYLQASDIKDIAHQSGLKRIITEMMFTRNKVHFATKLQKLMKNKELLKNMGTISQLISQERSTQKRIEIEKHDLYSPQIAWISLQWSRVNQTMAKLPSIFANA